LDNTVYLKVFYAIARLGGGGYYVFLARSDRIERNSYVYVAGWVVGWMAVFHSRYCITATKRIINILDHMVAPSFQIFWPLTPIPNSNGNSLHRGR